MLCFQMADTAMETQQALYSQWSPSGAVVILVSVFLFLEWNSKTEIANDSVDLA